MKFAFIIYNGMTTLDFLGVYDPISRLKTRGYRDDIEWDIVAFTDEVTDQTGQLTIKPNKVRPNLSEYDLFVVPGGPGGREARETPGFIEWIQAGIDTPPYRVSVCGGGLILGVAGYLTGKRATTNRNALKALEEFAGQVLDQQVVEDGNVITAEGVSSSLDLDLDLDLDLGLDLGLYLVRKIAGPEVMEKVRESMEYNGFDKANITDFGEPLKLGATVG